MLQPLASAMANDRIALVIGNSDYPASPLRNPVNDARDIAARFRELGFNVIHYENTSYLQMENAVREFGDLLNNIKGIGIFFYAGHGLQVNGRNYLMPVDADIQDETEVKHKALDVDFVLGKMELAQNSVNLLILDACRNNPFERSFRSVMSRGLAPMNAPSGTVIWYATRPGKVASDGQGRNSPFTRNLLDTLNQNNVEARKVISKIAVNMRDEKLQQEPWQEGIWLSDFYFLKEDAPVTSPQLKVDTDAEKEQMHWRIIKDLNQANVFEDYLDKCGREFTCLHKQEAYIKLATIAQQKNKESAKVAPKLEPAEPPKKVTNTPKEAPKELPTSNVVTNISLGNIYQGNLLASASPINLQSNDQLISQLGGNWQCKWRDTANNVLEQVINLTINKVTNRSFRGTQTLASPLCPRSWPLKGKLSGDNLSYVLSPSAANSAAACKYNKRYVGKLYAVTSSTTLLDMKYSGVGYQDNGQMRCKKLN